MSSLSYDQVFSRLYTMIKAYDFLDLNEIQINEFLCNWLHSTVSSSHVRRLFTSIKLDDEVQTITFTIKNAIDSEDDESDKDYIIEILAMGMAICWLTPKVASMETVTQTYGTNELKFYSESSHLKEVRELLSLMKSNQKQEIANHSVTWNSYLNKE